MIGQTNRETDRHPDRDRQHSDFNFIFIDNRNFLKNLYLKIFFFEVKLASEL